jgi:hypothetical protein
VALRQNGKDKGVSRSRVALGFVVAGVASSAVGCGASSTQEVPGSRSALDEYEIVVSGPDSRRRIGTFRYAGTTGSGYTRAVRAFGRPSSRGTNSNLCTVRWRRLGIDVDFATRKSRGAWYGSRVYTRAWHTERGLRVGDRESRIRQLYPKAKFRDRPPNPPFWSLLRERHPYPIGLIDTLTAEVWGGYVVAIRIPPDYIF